MTFVVFCLFNLPKALHLKLICDACLGQCCCAQLIFRSGKVSCNMASQKNLLI